MPGHLRRSGFGCWSGVSRSGLLTGSRFDTGLKCGSWVAGFQDMARHLKWSHVYRLYEAFEPWLKQSIPKETKPAGNRIIVLAPHIDDETIVAGGVLLKHTRAGDRVAILTFADCTPPRIAEGKAAGALLGIQRQEFLGFESRGLLNRSEPADALARFVTEEHPDLIYAPSLFDRHTDHVAVNVLLARLTRRQKLSVMIYGYEVWSTLTPNVAVDISAEKESKARALACFVSQTQANDWTDAALSLNRYRGITTGAGAYAEAFLRLTSARHAELVGKFWG